MSFQIAPAMGDSVPSFQISDVKMTTGGVEYYNFDTVNLSMNIIDKDDKVIGDVMSEIKKYINALTERAV